MTYRVRIDSFEGPFDLLVYLIESAEMSIYEIKISEITAQYLDFVRLLEQTDVMDTAEFMVLAATLIEIKSKLMLPRIGDDQAEDGMEMRDTLISMLVEYKKIKRRAVLLKAALWEGSMVFEKPSEDLDAYKEEPEELLKMDIEEFMLAFSNFIYKKRKDIEIASIQDKIQREALSLDRKKDLILTRINRLGTGEEISFKDLVLAKDNRKEHILDEVLTFMSILDLGKDEKMRSQQDYNFDDIRLARREVQT